jgi:hypothetical protein
MVNWKQSIILLLHSSSLNGPLPQRAVYFKAGREHRDRHRPERRASDSLTL